MCNGFMVQNSSLLLDPCFKHYIHYDLYEIVDLEVITVAPCVKAFSHYIYMCLNRHTSLVHIGLQQ